MTKFRDVHMLCYTYDSMERPSLVCIVSYVSCFRCGSKVLPAFTGSARHAFTASNNRDMHDLFNRLNRSKVPADCLSTAYSAVAALAFRLPCLCMSTHARIATTHG